MKETLLPQINRYMFNKKESIVVKDDRYASVDFTSQYELTKTVAVMLCNLYDLGYTIPHEEIPKLLEMSPEDLNEVVYKPLLEEAKVAKGAHVEHRVLFPGFPDTVKSLDIDTLSNIRFISYFTTALDSYTGYDALEDGSITRDVVDALVQRSLAKAERQYGVHTHREALGVLKSDETYFASVSLLVEKAVDGVNKTQIQPEHQPRVIHLVTEEAYFDMVKNMLAARTSLSEYDKEIVRFAIDNFDKEQYMPEKIQFRETQTMLDQYNFSKGNIHNIDIRTMADFERLLVSLSDGDVSLSKKQHVRNFSNQERRRLFEIFNNAITKNWPTMVESAANRQTLRTMDNVLKNRLHFNEMGIDDGNKHRITGQYSRFARAAEERESVMAAFERNMRERKFGVAANILAKHSPTLLIQHAKHLLTKAHEDYSKTHSKESYKQVQGILKQIAECSKKTSIKDLMSLETAITAPHVPYRIMMPKSTKVDIKVKENKSAPFPQDLVAPALRAIDKGIQYQLSNCQMTGQVQINQGTKVYVDPALSGCPLPTVGRNDTGKNRTVMPGTKLPVQKCDILRAALYKQNDIDQFIDFSCGFLDKDYKMVGQVSWNNLQQKANGKMMAYHSGDTMACSGKGCTEVIDLDLNVAKQQFPDAKYVVYSAIMWNSSPLSSCNQLFMTLAPTQELGQENGQKLFKSNAQEIYNPADVQFKVDIVGDAFTAIPMVYDIENHQVMILNIESKVKDLHTIATNPRHFDLPSGCECLENYSTDMSMKCFAFDNLRVPTMMDLARHYIECRGAVMVDTPEQADVIFATDRIVVEDKRPEIEGKEKIAQVIVTPFDKDVVTGELIPDPKSIVSQEGQQMELEIDLPEIGNR